MLQETFNLRHLNKQQKAKKSFWFLVIVLWVWSFSPTAVFAHAGHGNEFEGEAEAASVLTGIEVDPETIKRMGILIEAVGKELMDVGIKTTGQIESVPSQKVKITSPIAGKVLQLLVELGDRVKADDVVAILSSPELVNLRVESLEKRAEAEADIQQAKANLELARQDYQRQQKIATAEIESAQKRVAIAQIRYERDRALVNEEAVVNVARENYQRQLEIALAEIAQAETELAVAKERYERDRDLVAAGALPRREMLDSEANFAQAQTQLAKVKSRREVLAAEAEVKRAEVELPLRDLRESEDMLTEAQAQLTKAKQSREVLAAEAEIQRAEAALTVAESRLKLSEQTYQTRLKQLGNSGNSDGNLTIKAPIDGTISERSITLGQSVDAAGEILMTVLDDSSVWATANIYEKDLANVQVGQRVNVKVSSFPNRTFSGRIAVISSLVDGETRVVPVKAQLDNADGVLKPGMFAELEVVTDRTTTAVMTIPTRAIVEVNNQPTVYVQNGQSFAPVAVEIGTQFGEKVEVKSGLFEGDRIVTEGAMQLYAQSLRGGNHKPEKSHPEAVEEKMESGTFAALPSQVPGWVWGIGGSAISAVAFWLGRRTKLSFNPKSEFANFYPEHQALPEAYLGEFGDVPVLAEESHQAKTETRSHEV